MEILGSYGNVMGNSGRIWECRGKVRNKLVTTGKKKRKGSIGNERRIMLETD